MARIKLGTVHRCPAPETYNLTGILEQVKKANMRHPSD